MLDRLKAMREALPVTVTQREIAVPEEVPGYDDYRRFGRDNWRQLGRAVWTDGNHILVWSPLDPDPSIATLQWGQRAQAVIARYSVSPPGGNRPGGGGTLLVFCQHCKLEIAELAPTCPASKNGRHSTMSRWVKGTAQPSLFTAMNEKPRPLVESDRGASQEV